MRPRIVFEIGAHHGGSLIEKCRQDPALEGYAFEPVPEYCRRILARARGVPNYHLFQTAVSDYDGEAWFHLSHDPMGCDSLNDFAPDAVRNWQKPFEGNVPQTVPAGRPAHRDFRMKARIRVAVTRLDTFMAKYQIPHINKLKIDAQGEDLRVLRSLGERIRDVKAGVIEAAVRVPLYRNQPLKAEIIRFLKAHNFDIRGIDAQYFGMEENITFARP